MAEKKKKKEASKEAPKEAPKEKDPSVEGAGYVHLPKDGEATNGSPYSPITEVVKGENA